MTDFSGAIEQLINRVAGTVPSVGMELRVVVGRSKEHGRATTARRVGKRGAGCAYVETWDVEGRTFECYDDRRRQWTRDGGSFGSLGDGEYVWDAAV